MQMKRNHCDDDDGDDGDGDGGGGAFWTLMKSA